MKILVCVKQVPDTESPLEINRDKTWISETDRMAFRMSRYDEYALEEAILIRESLPGTTVDAVTVGPARAAAVVKKSLEKGADNGIHVVTDESGYCPPAVTARLIAEHAGANAYDLILAGVMSEDCMQGLTGPMIAALLSIPCAASVITEAPGPGSGTLTVECEYDGGSSETAVISLPAVLTIQSGINRPRYPSLSNVLRAKSQEILTFSASVPGNSTETESILSIDHAHKSQAGVFIQGTPDEKAEQLLKVLHENSFI